MQGTFNNIPVGSIAWRTMTKSVRDPWNLHRFRVGFSRCGIVRRPVLREFIVLPFPDYGDVMTRPLFVLGLCAAMFVGSVPAVSQSGIYASI